MSDALFDYEVLKELDLGELQGLLNGSAFPEVGENLVLRPLKASDYEKGFLNVLEEFVPVGNVTEALFLERFNFMKSCPETYYSVVIEDVAKNVIAATAALVIELTFTYECGQRGRIINVVVGNDYKGYGLGKILMLTLSALARKLNCHKATLECKDPVLRFYNECGFREESDRVYHVQKFFSQH